MGCLTKEDRDKIKEILRSAADMEAEEIISFAENLYGVMPAGESVKDWANKQAAAFAAARVEITKQFTESLREKMKQ